MSNLAYACAGCNNRKYNVTEARDPATGATVPLFHPRRDRWSEHFGWSEDLTRVVGRTAVGRATVVKLHLNRAHLVALRDLLRVVGEHPPEDAQ